VPANPQPHRSGIGQELEHRLGRRFRVRG
jgi:hypothetical protein